MSRRLKTQHLLVQQETVPHLAHSGSEYLNSDSPEMLPLQQAAPPD
ncbi:MAG: hypothetical protein ACE5JB_04230 [bacterium]